LHKLLPICRRNKNVHFPTIVRYSGCSSMDFPRVTSTFSQNLSLK
jgi:hypothetical protein